MSESMYWGLLVFLLVVFWLLSREIRRFIGLRTQVNVRDLVQKERVAAIAAKITEWHLNEPVLAEKSSALVLLENAAAKEIFFLGGGLLLIAGGVGVGLALKYSEVVYLTSWASFAWIPICLGAGLVIFFSIDKWWLK